MADVSQNRNKNQTVGNVESSLKPKFTGSDSIGTNNRAKNTSNKKTAGHVGASNVSHV